MFLRIKRFACQSNQLYACRNISVYKKTGNSPNKSMIDKVSKEILNEITSRPLEQPIFLQAVEEVLNSLNPLFIKYPHYIEIFKLLCIPEKSIMFQVPWVNDKGVTVVNHGYRVQYSNTLGPYKGGLRFHPSVDLSTMKFLSFEQTFKNSLTGLSIGSAKGGSNFDPKGKSIREIYKFCKAFMTGLYPFIGPNRDVPAGDIGVGSREIGYLYGQYKLITSEFQGVITGKSIEWGGSILRPEATGYGLIYITNFSLQYHGDTIEDKRCLVSGSGNVATYAAEKLIELGAKVITLSDSNGTVYVKDGFDMSLLHSLMEVKKNRKRCSDFAKLHPSVKYFENKTPWEIETDINYAFPCATENEIDSREAKLLIDKKCQGIYEGANMPLTNKAVDLIKNKMYYIPGKAANAGGVSVSCFEMAQNSARISWTKKKVDKNLKQTMHNIYDKCLKAAKQLGDEGNIQLGANAAGYKRVADAMINQGHVFFSDL